MFTLTDIYFQTFQLYPLNLDACYDLNVEYNISVKCPYSIAK